MIDEAMKELIEKEAMVLATVNESGNPHVIVVGYAKVKDNKIIITDNFMAETPKNIAKNNNVELLVWSRDWEGKDCKAYEFKGTASYETTGEWAKFVKELEVNKGYAAKAAVVVTVTNVKKLA